MAPDGSIRRVEVLAFDEPEDYLPRPVCYGQFVGRTLDAELALKQAIRPVAGAVYFVLKHLVTSDDPYAVVNHPLQPQLQHLHVLLAPLLVFSTGLLWTHHATPAWNKPSARRWRSGVSLLLSFVPMVASGYLLQTATDAPWRTIWLWTHLGSSGVWLLGYAVHAAQPVFNALRRWRGPGAADAYRRASPRAGF